MTNPSNAVEKPATGCGCGYGTPPPDSECPVGENLWNAVLDAYQRYIRRWPDEDASRELHAIRDYRTTWEAWRAHVEDSG